MQYYKYISILLVLFLSVLLASPQDCSKTNDNERAYSSPSRVMIGEGAKVIVDTKTSARLWYDDIVLSNNSKYITDTEELELNRINDDDEKISSVAVTALPTELTISKAFPNPFNPIVSIAYGLPSSSDVSILIYDLSGKKIMEYALQGQSAGWHEFKWNALDLSGQSIGSGLYLMTIRAGDMVKRQKITYLK